MTRTKLVSVQQLWPRFCRLQLQAPASVRDAVPAGAPHRLEKTVGAAGPAMSGGQLMAGVGQCQRIGGWHSANTYDYWTPGYGYDGPHWGASAYAPYEE